MQRVNISDVARRAGVSPKTVSRVINRETNVSDAMRKKVNKAISELNFEPDRRARSLRSGKSLQIGFIYGAPSSYYVISLVEGIRQTCRELGFELILHETNAKGSRLLLSVMEFIERSRLDGVLMMPPLTDNEQLIALFEDAGITYGRITPGTQHKNAIDVHTTDRSAGREMIDHLLSLGHRRIAFISGDPEHLTMIQRLNGVKDGISQYSGDCELIIQQGFNTFSSGRKAAHQLLSLQPRPTAIFAANDDMAAGVIYEAQELALRIPEDISIVGFDDTLLAAQIWPGLTTVRQPTKEMGASIAHNLIDHIMGKHIKQTTPFPTEIIIRRSSGLSPQLNRSDADLIKV